MNTESHSSRYFKNVLTETSCRQAVGEWKSLRHRFQMLTDDVLSWRGQMTCGKEEGHKTVVS